ncbi:lysylphosphatidylglycerol synthase transmembrane domain-containing protein [Sulfuricella denitrificans]|uniref:lysylphosphatidylglycerol synthase transmembrane domain-containing protein n=1 Tax=Sulfuricella denitrificans TaxID=649841 RepID=UPI0002F63671|nr:lysylphosphatidylglycerol synthase transmembrane domain-containing protein [Sulfuricella denitrificans]
MHFIFSNAVVKSVVKFLLKLLISIGLVVLIGRSVNIQEIGMRLMNVDISSILMAAVIMASLAIFPAIRWKILIQHGGEVFNLSTAYRLVMIGNFFGQALPSTIGGDGARAWYAHKLGIPLSVAVNSVLLDRLIALAALLLLALFSMPWLWTIVPTNFAWWAMSLILLATVSGILLLLVATLIPETWNHWRIVRAGLRLADSCRSLLESKREFFQVIGLSLSVHCLVAVFVYALARVVHVPVGIGECLLLIPLVMLVSMIPVSVAGWGVREGAMVIAFGFFHISPGDSMLVSILFGVVVALASIPGLFFWMMMGRRFGMGKK